MSLFFFLFAYFAMYDSVGYMLEIFLCWAGNANHIQLQVLYVNRMNADSDEY